MSFSFSIFQAARDGQISEIERYLNNGFEINAKDKNGMTPLHWALEAYPRVNPPHETVHYLVEQGADVNAKDNYGLTPLYRSALLDLNSIAQFLLSRGAKPELPAAILIGDEKYFNEYLSCVKDPNQSVGCYTPMHWVAYSSDSSRMIAQLIGKRADINVQDSLSGRTPLHLASLCQHKNIVQQLLLAGADPNVQDFEGKTPLHLAAKKDDLSIVKLLVEYGAKLNLRSGIWGFTALHFSQSLRVREYLKSQGAKSEMYRASRVLFSVGIIFKGFLESGFTW